MRLVAWNCNMALHRKLDALRALAPDLAVLSESADPSRLCALCETPPPSMVWIGRNPTKGLLVAGFGATRVALDAGYEPDLQHVAPVRVSGPRRFNLLAVWAQNASAGNWRRNKRGPIRDALARYDGFLRAGPSVVAGDFNNHVRWEKAGWPINHSNAVADLAALGLSSAYHELRGVAQGDESEPTHYWRDRRRDGPTYHIDYVFAPHAWLAGASLSVGSFDDWVASRLSDHVPLVLDLA
jgi:exodeoxyribonuclease III